MQMLVEWGGSFLSHTGMAWIGWALSEGRECQGSHQAAARKDEQLESRPSPAGRAVGSFPEPPLYATRPADGQGSPIGLEDGPV